MLRRMNSSRTGLGAALLIGLSLVLTLVATPANATVIDSTSFGGHTYYLISENTWTGAAAEAGSLGGYLATINSAAEQNFLWNAWKNSLGTGEALWIGLHDQSSTYQHGGGSFVWMNGEPVTFTNWAPGEPSDGHPSGNYKEDYVAMESRFGYNGGWNDLPNAGSDWNPDRGIVEVNSSSSVQTPEVSTLVLVGSGLVGLVRRRRRLGAERRGEQAAGR